MAKSLSSEPPSSTSMFPVDEPMNTLTPGISDAFTPVPASPSLTSSRIMSALLLVAPIWKPVFMRLFSFAISILPFRAAASTVAGLVFGISNTVVTPPAAAARDSVAMSALWVSPGSRKWTCASMPPAIRYFPLRSTVFASGKALAMSSNMQFMQSALPSSSFHIILLMLSPSRRTEPVPSLAAVTIVAL